MENDVNIAETPPIYDPPLVDGNDILTENIDTAAEKSNTINGGTFRCDEQITHLLRNSEVYIPVTVDDTNCEIEEPGTLRDFIEELKVKLDHSQKENDEAKEKF